MRQAVTRVPGDDVDVVVALVFANELHIINGLDNLSAPFVVNRANLRETLPGPILKLLELSCGVFLTNLVIAATNDKVIMLFIALGETNILVRLSLVVKETVLNDTLRNTSSDTRDTGCFDSVAALDSLSIACLYLNGFVADAENFNTLFLDRHDAGLVKAAEVGLRLEPFQNTVQILCGVEGCLVLDDEASSLVDGSIPATDS
ncbi:hypothetical protein HG530_001756 [Fusarium avenaceum]|nr:hypothetical protein HG530_001756 [Fusarium avenaceum]